MALPGRLFFLLGFVGLGYFFSAPAYAECGGNIQCIGVGATAANARVAHHTNGPWTFTLDYGNQSATTTSAAKTVYVAAVTGPAPSMAILGPTSLSGTNAADFSITGGTCSPTNGPVQDAWNNGTLVGGTLCTITVAFTPATLGAKTATLHVPLNPPCGGCITERVVTLTGIGTAIAAPTAGATTLTVPVNTATTLDLAPFVAGTGITGVTVTAAPAHGTAVANGTVVTYTPTHDYFGADAFSYAAVGSGGTSAPAVVSVSVVGRSDPSKDANVIGLIGAQAQTARRFSRAQIVNYQRRMESLHHGADAGDATTTGGTGFGARRSPGPGPNPASGPVMSRNFFTSPGAGAAGSGADIAASAQPQGPFERTPNEPGGSSRLKGLAGDAAALLPASFAKTLVSAATTRSVNLANSSDRAAASSALPAGTGMWIGGNLNFGTRDETSDSNSLRFSTSGISVGADQWISDKLALGLGLGYARDTTDIGTDGTRSRSTGSSIAAYGSYQSSTNTFVDGLIGYGALGHDTDRYVAAVGDFARAHRNGDQLFGSLAVGYEHRNEGLLLSPYARLDVAVDRLKQTTETGAGLNALTYFDQTLQTRQLSLGLRIESKHETRFGWALPRLRLEFRHDFEGDQHATIAFADQFAGPTYSVMPAGVNRNSQLIGIGSDFLLRDGLKLGIDYQVQRSFGPDSSQAIRLWLSQDLDGKGLRSGPSLPSKMFEDPVMVEAGYTWDNNLTRAIDAADKLSDHIYGLNVSKGTIFPVSSDTRMVFTGFLNAEKLHTYTGLDRVSGGIQGEFQYRTSGAFAAPTFGLFGRATFDDYVSQLRGGKRYSFGISAREALTDRIDAFIALAGNVRDAKSDVFDGRDRGARFNLDYSLGQDGALYFGGEVRRGDSVSSGRTPLANAKFSVPDDAYGSEPLFAYRYDAKTVLWTLGYNWPVGPRDSFDCSWRRAQSTPTQQPGPGGAYGAGSSATAGTSRYAANQFSVAYLMRF